MVVLAVREVDTSQFLNDEFRVKDLSFQFATIQHPLYWKIEVQESSSSMSVVRTNMCMKSTYPCLRADTGIGLLHLN